MIGWRTISIAATVLASAGAAADLLLLRRQEKGHIYDGLVKSWLWLDSTRVVDFPNEFAVFTSSLARVLPTSKVRLFLLTVVVSWIVTSAAWMVGWSVDRTYILVKWHDILPWYPYYVGNYFFDLLTLLIAAWSVKKLITDSAVRAVVVIAALFVASAILAITCIVASVRLQAAIDSATVKLRNYTSADVLFSAYADDTDLLNSRSSQRASAEQEIEREFGQAVSVDWLDLASIRYIIWSYRDAVFGGRAGVHVFRSRITIHAGNTTVVREVPAERLSTAVLLFGVTTLIPVVVFCTAFVAATLAKIFAVVARTIVMRVIEVVTEPAAKSDPRNFMPGTLAGTFVGMLAVLTKAIADLLGR